MFILGYKTTGAEELELQEEEFDEIEDAQERACELIEAQEATDFRIADEDGAPLRDDAAIRARCQSQSVVSLGRIPMRGRQRITIRAAIFNERGQRYAVVSVRESLLFNQSEADRAWNQAMRLFGMPVILIGGRRRHGDPNLVRAFQRIDPRRITGWQDFTFTL